MSMYEEISTVVQASHTSVHAWLAHSCLDAPPATAAEAAADHVAVPVAVAVVGVAVPAAAGRVTATLAVAVLVDVSWAVAVALDWIVRCAVTVLGAVAVAVVVPVQSAAVHPRQQQQLRQVRLAIELCSHSCLLHNQFDVKHQDEMGAACLQAKTEEMIYHDASHEVPCSIHL